MGQQIGSFFKSKYTGQQIENMLDSATNIADQYDPAASYVVGDLVLYNNGLYVCTGATSGTFDPAKWQQTTLDEILTNLGASYTDPNSDGNVVIGVDSTVGEKILRSLTFPGLTNRYYLPFAQYIRERLQNDPSASSFSVEIPDAEEAPMHSVKIKGKTAAVNQHSSDAWKRTITNEACASGTYAASDGAQIVGHTYFLQNIVTEFQSTDIASYRFYYDGTVHTQTGATPDVIFTATAVGAYAYQINFQSGNVGKTITKMSFAPNCIDLNTSPVASRLAEIGTDVAKLKQVWLEEVGAPLPTYIPYDNGSLANVNGVYRLRGRNLWDEEWEVGDLNGTTGQPQTSSTYIRSKNFCKCKANESIYVRATDNAYVFWYDANQNFISHTSTVQNSVVTSPSNAVYFKLTNKSTAYNYNITLNESDASIDGQYFPSYNGGEIDCSTAPLNGFDDTLCDVKDFATGERTDKCGIVDMGELPWSGASNSYRFYATVSGAKTGAKSKTAQYVSAGGNTLMASGTAGFNSAQAVFYLSNSAFDGYTSEQVKAALAGQKLVFELATPVVSTETPQPVYTQYGYNVLEPVSGGVQSAEVDTVYYENIAGYIDKKLAEG